MLVIIRERRISTILFIDAELSWICSRQFGKRSIELCDLIWFCKLLLVETLASNYFPCSSTEPVLRLIIIAVLILEPRFFYYQFDWRTESCIFFLFWSSSNFHQLVILFCLEPLLLCYIFFISLEIFLCIMSFILTVLLGVCSKLWFELQCIVFLL